MAGFSNIAAPYAKAAFEIAESQKALTAWSDFLTVAALVAADKDVVTRIKHPDVSADKLVSFFVSLCEPVALPTLGERFIALLAERKRLIALPKIKEIFDHYRDNALQRVQVQLTSAEALRPDEVSRIKEALEKRFSKEVIVDCDVDADLIGGTLIRAGDIVIDGSVRGRLEKVIERLL